MARVIFEPRDLWVGVYWNRLGPVLSVYICLLPTLPLQLLFVKEPTDA